MMKWYILQVYSGYEKQVRLALQDRISRYHTPEQFGEILIPTEEVLETRKNGKKVITERKLYPNYVFLQMDMNDETWHLVTKQVPKVTGFVGGSNQRPQPVSEKEIEQIREQMDENAKNPKPKVEFEVGESVRVIDGPFKDFTAKVESVNYEKSKLNVSVEIFGRSTPVEVEFSQIDKS